MKKIPKTGLLLLCSFIACSALSAQIDANNIFGTGSSNNDSEQLIQNLTNQVASADPYFNQAYKLININLPSVITRNPSLIKEAESRYTKYRYLMGVIRARSKFMYDTKQTIIKLKKEYQNNNPLPYISYDMRSTVDSQALFRANQIRARTKVYDDAISCVDEMYKKYQNRIGDLLDSARRLAVYVIQYKVNIERKDENYMRNNFEGFLMQEENRGMKDAGAMSNTEYQIRSFALNFLIPMFDSASNKNPAESLPEALVKVFQLLPKP